MADKWPPAITGVEQQSLAKLLAQAGFNYTRAEFKVLAGDGSDRRFVRISSEQQSLVVVLPALFAAHGEAEARSAWLIGNHLRSCGVPVPEMHGYDPETGIFICEDLGDRLLHHEIMEIKDQGQDYFSFYEPVVEILAHMQIEGAKAFQADWCWDTGIYDRQLMLARESGYFVESCCHRLLGITDLPAGLQREFIQLADLAAVLPGRYFLHRDFQSRNIMIKGGCTRVIDFQGGRFGPLGYDLASLLIDPYVSLSDEARGMLVQKYCGILAGYPGVAAEFSVEGYHLLAIQRNLQILGAFSFLVCEKDKNFFRNYLVPAALGLRNLVREPVGKRFPVLRVFANELPEMLGIVFA